MQQKLIGLLLVLIFAPTVFAETSGSETAVVTNIVDGDTIDVWLNGETKRVRYIGMDTPESYEPFFDEATEANRVLVEGQTVTLVKDVSETDIYGRLLRYVYLADNTFVNAKLVEDGWARAASYPPDTAHAAEFAQLEAEAQAEERGMWGLFSYIYLPLMVNGMSTMDVPVDAQIVIVKIFYDGIVPNTEADEYIEIKNVGNTAVNLHNWHINAGDNGQTFFFPATTLQPNAICRIFTNQMQNTGCTHTFASGRPLWANAGDCGYLYNQVGQLVDEYCY